MLGDRKGASRGEGAAGVWAGQGGDHTNKRPPPPLPPPPPPDARFAKGGDGKGTQSRSYVLNIAPQSFNRSILKGHGDDWLGSLGG